MMLGTITIGSGWIALTVIILCLLGMRYSDQIAAWWHRCNLVGRKQPKVNDDYTINGYSKGFTWREEWSRGKQVTFMEPEPSPVVKVASRSIHDSLAMAQADPSAYWLGPRRDHGGGRIVYTAEQMHRLNEREYPFP